MHLIPVVEGHGEVDAVPVLLRRLCAQLGQSGVQIGRPIRCARQKMVQMHELTRVVELAARKLIRPGGVMVLLDADSDCPARLGPELSAIAAGHRPDVPIAVVLAKREYEAWLLAGLSVESMKRSVEEIQSPKEHLRRLRGRYSPTVDQPALTAEFDLSEARRLSPSFDKFVRETERLLLSRDPA